MNLGPVLGAAIFAQAACRRLGLKSCVIGGLALQRWGEPRFTADADLAVLAEPGDEPRIIRQLLEALPARVPDAADFATRSRVVLAQSEQGVGIDIVLAGLPYEARVIARASDWDLGGDGLLRTCSAEDLIVMKSFAGRDKDWADITGVLERQGRRLDLELVRRELTPLLAAKEAPELLIELERRIEQHVSD